VKCQLDLLGGLARAQSLDADCRVGLGVRPPKVRHVLLDLIKVVLVFRPGEFFVDRASVIIKEDDSIKNVDRVVLHDDQGGSRSFDDVPIWYHQPTWGKGDDSLVRLSAREGLSRHGTPWCDRRACSRIGLGEDRWTSEKTLRLPCPGRRRGFLARRPVRLRSCSCPRN